MIGLVYMDRPEKADKMHGLGIKIRTQMCKEIFSVTIKSSLSVRTSPYGQHVYLVCITKNYNNIYVVSLKNHTLNFHKSFKLLFHYEAFVISYLLYK